MRRLGLDRPLPSGGPAALSRRRQDLGRRAERLAEERLAAAGLTALARNARVRDPEAGLSGELDLVVLGHGSLVFVEVKAGRTGRPFGPERPALAVGAQKRARLRRLGGAWLAARPALPPFHSIRFDVVGVTYAEDGSASVEWIRNAF